MVKAFPVKQCEFFYWRTPLEVYTEIVDSVITAITTLFCHAVEQIIFIGNNNINNNENNNNNLIKYIFAFELISKLFKIQCD